MGLVVLGHSLTEILRDKTLPGWRERELAAWYRGSGESEYHDLSPIARKQFDEATDAVARVMFSEDALREHKSQAPGA
jgi:hypothetical protein